MPKYNQKKMSAAWWPFGKDRGKKPTPPSQPPVTPKTPATPNKSDETWVGTPALPPKEPSGMFSKINVDKLDPTPSKIFSAWLTKQYENGKINMSDSDFIIDLHKAMVSLYRFITEEEWLIDISRFDSPQDLIKSMREMPPSVSKKPAKFPIAPAVKKELPSSSADIKQPIYSNPGDYKGRSTAPSKSWEEYEDYEDWRSLIRGRGTGFGFGYKYTPPPNSQPSRNAPYEKTNRNEFPSQQEIMDYLKDVFPEDHGGEDIFHDKWGLFSDAPLGEVRKILIATTPTEGVKKQFEKGEYDLLIGHHPFLVGVPTILFHLAMDFGDKGHNAYFAKRLGLKNTSRIGGLSIKGELPIEMSISGFLQFLNRRGFKVKGLVWGNPKRKQGSDMIKTVVFCSGGGGMVLSGGLSKGKYGVANEVADAFVTGELQSHPKNSPNNFKYVIELGHTPSERPAFRSVSNLLRNRWKNLQIDMAGEDVDKLGEDKLRIYDESPAANKDKGKKKKKKNKGVSLPINQIPPPPTIRPTPTGIPSGPLSVKSPSDWDDYDKMVERNIQRWRAEQAKKKREEQEGWGPGRGYDI